MGQWIYRTDGTRYKNPNWKPPKDTKPKSPGGGGSYTSGGGTTGKTSGSNWTAEDIANLKRALTANYNSLFKTGGRALPASLWAQALKGRWSDTTQINLWMRDNFENGLYLKTTEGKSRADVARYTLEAVFGEKRGISDAVLKAWLKSDPGKDLAASWNKFFDSKVVRSKEFKKEFPNFNAFRLTSGQKGKSYEESITDYRSIQRSAEDWYRGTMEDATLKLPEGMLSKLLAEGITDEQEFKLWLKNDPTYKKAMETKSITSSLGQTKGDEIEDLWHTLYGEDDHVPSLIKQGYQKTDSLTSITDYFNNIIRTSDKFKASEPDFEAWADGMTGAKGGGVHVDPLQYYSRKRELEQAYEVMAETIGATDPELIKRAMKNNWSDARLLLEFKNSPAYEKTEQFKVKAQKLDGYWKSIFGVDAPVDGGMASAFARSSSNDVTSMFEQIKGTALFQQQYGNWDAFQQASDAKGMSGDILNNPALYKAYKAAFYQAFADVGLKPPDNFEKMFFTSGIEEDEIKTNMRMWNATEASSTWMTGETADVATAAGIGDKVAGGDLKLRMEKAWEAHKKYAASDFTTASTKKTDSGLITQGI